MASEFGYRLLAAVMVSSGDLNAIERNGNRGIMLYEGYFELLARLGVAWCKVTQDSLDSMLWTPDSLSVGLDSGFSALVKFRIS